MTLNNVPMIVAMTKNNLVGVNAKTGQLLWHNKTAKPAENCPSPVFFGNRVFEANGYGVGGVAVDLTVSENGVSAKQVWTTKDMDCHHGGYVLVDGYIYGNNGPGWACLDFKTGQTKWKDPGVGKGCIIYADGMLYTQSEAAGDSKDGKTKGRVIGLVKASPEAFTMVSKFSLPLGGQGFVWAHPAIANGRLYIRHGDMLYCYDIKGAGGEK
jgi:outer membrane protein assembly factor BamB